MPKQPFVPVPQIIRVRYAGTRQGAPWVNGFALHYAGARPDNTAMQTLADQMAGQWGNAWTTHLLTDTQLLTTQVWDITDASGASAESTQGHQGAVAVNGPMPCQVAVVVSWPVQDRWRGGHFRTYMPARNLTDTTNGRTLVNTSAQDYASAAALFRTNVNSMSWANGPVVLCGVRYFPTGFDTSGKPLVKTTGQRRDFNIPIVHTRLDTQRRRLGKELA